MRSPFRKEFNEGVVTPEQLSDYLHVTGPGIWAILVASMLVLMGIVAWSVVGTLEIAADANVVMRDGTAAVVVEDARPLKSGMTVRVSDLAEFEIATTSVNDFGMTIGYGKADLPNGEYEDAVVVTDYIEPISFLLESR